MSDDMTVGRINFLTNEPLQVSLGGTPFNKAHLDARAAEIKRLETALSEARAEIERLTERHDFLAAGFGVPDGGRYRADWQTRIDKFKATESELSTLRARVREVVGPFAAAADDICDQSSDSAHIWEAPCAMNITRGHLRAARQLNEDLTGKQVERDNQ